MQRYILTLLVLILFTLNAHAQREGFDPERFEARLTQHIIEAADFNTQEAQTFTAIRKEMHAKQMVIFKRIRQYQRTQENDPKKCRQIIQEMDKMELQLKQLQQTYHNKLLGKLPPEKVFAALKAEAQFHRKSFKKAAGRNKPHGGSR